MTTNAFQQVDRTTELFLEQCHQKEYPSKSIIIREGDPSADLFYIISGSVTVIVEDVKGKEIVLAYLNPGDFFGEIGLFDDEHKRSAFVRAKTKCEIAKISYERLRSMQDIFPDILFKIASQLAFRLR
jgi:CRP/FNR family cyclic AMP-dependent transcriptional regulator